MSPDEIRILRFRLGMTMDTMGELLDISPITISRWERGLMSPSPDYERRIIKMMRQYFPDEKL
jgi:transcriptional regulator with XRE-family HTH domain